MRSRKVAKNSQKIPHPYHPPVEDPGSRERLPPSTPTLRTKSGEGPQGVSATTRGKPREQRQPKGPRDPKPKRDPPCRQPISLPEQNSERGAGSRKPGKGPEARRPHSGVVITGTCPSCPGLPLSLSHFFPCWKVPVP